MKTKTLLAMLDEVKLQPTEAGKRFVIEKAISNEREACAQLLELAGSVDYVGVRIPKSLARDWAELIRNRED